MGGVAVASGPAYTLVPLGSLGGDSYSAGINDAGRIVGYSYLDSTYSSCHGFVYSNGVMSDVGAGTTQSQASAINNSGTIVGSTTVGMNYASATFSASGAQTLMPGDSFGSNALAVSNSGTIVGTANLAGGGQPAVFQSGMAVPLGQLPTGNGTGSANGINNYGQIVGAANIDPGSGATHPFLYSGNAMIDLFPSASSSWGSASAINNKGQVTGYLSDGNSTQAFLYDSTSGTATLLNAYMGNAINDNGTIVGSTIDGHGFVYANGVLQDLNDLVDPSLGWTITNATGINASGQIAATAQSGSMTQAVELVPVPEPAMLAVPMIGAFWVLLRRR